MQREKRGVTAGFDFDGRDCFVVLLSDVGLGEEEDDDAADDDGDDVRSSQARSTAVSNWVIANPYSGRNASAAIWPSAGSLEHRMYSIVEIPLSRAMTRRSAREGF